MSVAARVASLLCAVLVLLAPVAFGQEQLEAAVKAAYLYKFAGYVEWPASALPPGGPFVIGVTGADAVYDELAAMLPSRTVQGRPAVARRVRPGDPVDGVHVLFVGGAVADTHWPRALRGQPVLLVTDATDGLRRGGMLNFVLVDGRVRFEASVSPAEAAGLRLSSRLLSVAERVEAP